MFLIIKRTPWLRRRAPETGFEGPAFESPLLPHINNALSGGRIVLFVVDEFIICNKVSSNPVIKENFLFS